jgi:hypothetical protein
MTRTDVLKRSYCFFLRAHSDNTTRSTADPYYELSQYFKKQADAARVRVRVSGGGSGGGGSSGGGGGGDDGGGGDSGSGIRSAGGGADAAAGVEQDATLVDFLRTDSGCVNSAALLLWMIG